MFPWQQYNQMSVDEKWELSPAVDYPTRDMAEHELLEQGHMI